MSSIIRHTSAGLKTTVSPQMSSGHKGSELSTKEAKMLVQNGRRPHVNIDADIRHSEDPYEKTMLEAIEMCWKHDPHERASARQVQEHLAKYLL